MKEREKEKSKEYIMGVHEKGGAGNLTQEQTLRQWGRWCGKRKDESKKPKHIKQ